MGHRDYDSVLFRACRDARLTASQVRDLTYLQIGNACKCLGPGSSSPPDFFYRQIRNRVAGILAREEREAALEARRVELQQVLRAAPGLGETVVAVDDGGRFVVSGVAVAEVEIAVLPPDFVEVRSIGMGHIG